MKCSGLDDAFYSLNAHGAQSLRKIADSENWRLRELRLLTTTRFTRTSPWLQTRTWTLMECNWNDLRRLFFMMVNHWRSCRPSARRGKCTLPCSVIYSSRTAEQRTWNCTMWNVQHWRIFKPEFQRIFELLFINCKENLHCKGEFLCHEGTQTLCHEGTHCMPRRHPSKKLCTLLDFHRSTHEGGVMKLRLSKTSSEELLEDPRHYKTFKCISTV